MIVLPLESPRRAIALDGWPGRAPTRKALVRSTGRVAKRQEAAPYARVSKLIHRSVIRKDNPLIQFVPAWRCFLSLRDPAALSGRPGHPNCIGLVSSLTRLAFLAAGLFIALLAGCDRLDMYDQPRYKPLAASDFFSDGLSARPLEPGTISRGALHEDDAFYTGKEEGRLVSEIPTAALKAVFERSGGRSGESFDEAGDVEQRRALLARGRERYDIFCSVCHGRTGDGKGMIVRRGFRAPPSYHIDRLREAPSGHFFDVMSNGFGAMASYANRIEVADRWAIVAYIRALQLSQNARLEDVPGDEREKLSMDDSEAPP